jgi:hypothetical protein
MLVAFLGYFKGAAATTTPRGVWITDVKASPGKTIVKIDD